MSLKGQPVVANGIRFNVVIEGEGPDVLLLHGFPDSAYIWRNQIPALVQAGYRVIAPDLRGFGDSETPIGKENYTIDTLVKDVTGIMDYMGIKRAPIIGHDWGAFLGWFLSIRHPERVERYTAISVGHPSSFKRGGLEQKIRSWYMYAFHFKGIAEISTRAFNWQLARLLTQKHPETSHWIEDMARPGRLAAGMDWYRANTMRIMFTKTESSRVPTFGIWSDRDLFLTEKQMKMSTLYVDAPWQYARIENCSHWIQLDATDRLNKLLIEYLKQPMERYGI